MKQVSLLYIYINFLNNKFKIYITDKYKAWSMGLYYK